MSKRDLFAPFRPAYQAEVQKHNGPKYWRSLEHRAGDVVDEDVEFPSGTAPLTEFQRRDVLKLAGASMALAGLSTACVRRPVDEILPYTHQPEEVVPGIATRYATVQARSTGAVGLVVTAYEGRPTKIEGNPLHAGSGGSADIWAQSEILRLWDPDRTRQPQKGLAGQSMTAVDGTYEPCSIEGNSHRAQALGGETTTWAEWQTFALSHFGNFAASGGKGLAFLTDGADKPTVDRLLAEALVKWPAAKLYRWDPLNAGRSEAAAAQVFGAGARLHHDLSKASVIVALDANFLVDGADSIATARGFGKGRRVKDKSDTAAMNRLYVVEGVFSNAGSNADHRLRLAPSQIPAFFAAVVGELQKLGTATGDLPSGAAPAGSEAFATAVAKDLAANKGKALVVVGERQPVALHAAAAALNAALGAGESQLQTVTTGPSKDSHGKSIGDLAAALNAGEVDTLVVIDVNAVATAPGGLDFGAAVKKAKTVIHAGLIADETAWASHWHLPLAHWLESWGDATSWNGQNAVVQPLILPIFGARSDVSILGGIIAGEHDDKKLVEKTWSLPNKTWRKALHDGVLPQNGRAASTAAPTTAGIADAYKALPQNDGRLEVALTFGAILDGRLGNLPWNQELPDTMSKLCWDNALMVSPKYAKTLGIKSAVKRNQYLSTIVTLEVEGKTIRVPTFVLPGIEDSSAELHLGYGRKAGVVAANVGVDAFPLTGKEGGKLVFAKLTVTDDVTDLCSTQDHFSRPGDPFDDVSFAEATTRAKDKMVDGKLVLGSKTRVLGTTFSGKKEQSPIVRQGKLTQYKEKGGGFAHEGDIPSELVAAGTEVQKPKRPLQPTMDITYEGQQWGMVIDLTACIGCNACAVACVAENNISPVGRKQVLLGRELHWIRIDRYFVGDVENPTSMHQPINCMHCENAPCEPVCPVAATVHDEEGINAMAYNRCIGTRYCANNCPYKVRRFNYLDFTVTGNVYRDPEQAARADIYKYQRNPNVSVRYRGVMEKCTYCTQRIEMAKTAFKNTGGDRKHLPDGAVVPACAQTCPTEAITFGNVNDESSKVHALKKSDRNYELLQELNVRPRTTYLSRLQNNNTDLEG